jgi:hypothetical protein
LDVFCFKPFKIIFRKERNEAMAQCKFSELDKIILVGWVDRALDEFTTNKNILSRFKVTRIWPFNPKAMDAKIGPTNIYTIVNSNHEAKGEGHYTLDDEVRPIQQEEQL